jgi:hypothetical protein
VKILLALAAVALAAVLVASTTMGAGPFARADPARLEPAKRMPRGGIAPSNGKARLLPTSLAPLALKGVGFKAGENVTVRVTEGVTYATKRLKTSQAGGFSVRFATRADRCNGMTVTAVGDKGSRASFNFAQLLCAMPGAGQ